MATLCRQHPLTAAHISKIATLVDEKIGATIAEAVGEKGTAARASLPEWYELLAIVTRMKLESGGTSDPEPKPEPKPRAPRAKAQQSAAPVEKANDPTTGEEAGEGTAD